MAHDPCSRGSRFRTSPEVRSRRVPGYRIVQRLGVDPAAERRALVAGLRASPASIPPKYFYDALGCALYRRDLRAARVLSDAHRARDLRRAPRRRSRARSAAAASSSTSAPATAARREAGSPFLAPARYVAVDIAGDAIGAALARMAPEFPGVEMSGVVTDFTARPRPRRRPRPDLPTTFFYPGSSIGNFTPDEARRLPRARSGAHCARSRGSGLLIGVDTKKDAARLDAAYDDALGVTAAFNRNVLQPRQPPARQRLPARGVRASRVLRRARRAASRCTSRRRRRRR